MHRAAIAYQQYQLKYKLSLVLLFFILMVALTLALRIGSVSIDFSEMFASINQLDSLNHIVILDLRLPRIASAILVGGALAAAGVIMQGLFRNPLADPGLLGMTSGASLAAVAFILFANMIKAYIPELATWGLPISAFSGSLVITYFIYRLSMPRGTHSPSIAILMLAGVAINALIGSVIGLITYFANDNELRSLTFWTMGSLANSHWSLIFATLPLLITSWLLVKPLSQFLNAFSLGESQAKISGLNVNQCKKRAIIAIALLVGVATALAGPVGFIGLVVPQILRLTLGGDHRVLLPCAFFSGAILMIFSDTIARTVISPAELPIGLITAFIGSPYFVYLLIKQSRRGAL